MGTEVNGPRELTDEDRRRIRAEAEAVRDRVMAIPIEELKVQVRGRRAAALSARPTSSLGGGPRVDVARIVSLYTTEDMKPKDIAEVVGCSYMTVLKWLKDKHVYDPDKHRTSPRGPVPRDKCGKGHDLTQPGARRQKWKNGKKNGTECVVCANGRAAVNNPKRDRRSHGA